MQSIEVTPPRLKFFSAFRTQPTPFHNKLAAHNYDSLIWSMMRAQMAAGRKKEFACI